MRYKILAGLAAGLLATVGFAAPAQAISASSSDVYVVHGIPGATVDVYVGPAGGTLAKQLTAFTPGSVAGPLDLAAGNYDIKVFATGADPATATPVINVAGAAVPANKSVSLVAQYDAAGAPKLGVFVNDISTIPAGQGRITARHTAQAGAVAIVVNGAAAFDNVTNGQEGSTLLPVGTITAGVAGAGTTTPLVIPSSGTAANVSIEEGVSTIVYAVGKSNELQFVVQRITGLHSNPGGVNTGSAGLAADNNPTVIGFGIAGALALLIAAAFVGTRVRARSVNND